jgi:hypothetical protein
MVYYVTIDDNQIVSSSRSDTEVSLAANERYISEDIYNKLVYLPATFETDEHGNIISVTPAPEPELEQQPTPLPSIEELQAQQLAQAEAIAAIFEMLTGGEA